MKFEKKQRQIIYTEKRMAMQVHKEHDKRTTSVQIKNCKKKQGQYCYEFAGNFWVQGK